MEQQKHRGVPGSDFAIEHIYVSYLLSVKRHAESIITVHCIFPERFIACRSGAHQRRPESRSSAYRGRL